MMSSQDNCARRHITLEETLYWLASPNKLQAIKTETNELIAIFISLINKWRPKSR